MGAKRVHALGEWQILRETGGLPAHGEVPTRPLRVFTSSGELCVALDASGCARLLLPVHSIDVLPETGIADALNIAMARLISDGKSGAFIDVSCSEISLEPVFAEVCDVIASRIEGGDSCESALRKTLAEFAALFRTSDVSQEQARTVRGLLGELMYLDSLISRDPACVRLWRGADSERHDFAGSVHAVEIKTIARPDAPVTIGSFDQLLAPEGGSLHLRVFELHEASGGTLSVPGLVESIAGRCAEPAWFLGQVDKLGYSSAPDSPWARLCFDPGTVREWRVDNQFPAITREALTQLKAGLVGISYTIRPGDVPECECDEEQQLAMLQRLLSAVGASL